RKTVVGMTIGEQTHKAGADLRNQIAAAGSNFAVRLPGNGTDAIVRDELRDEAAGHRSVSMQTSKSRPWLLVRERAGAQKITSEQHFAVGLQGDGSNEA